MCELIKCSIRDCQRAIQTRFPGYFPGFLGGNDTSFPPGFFVGGNVSFPPGVHRFHVVSDLSTLFWACFLGGFQPPLYEGISRLGYFQPSTLAWLVGIS